MTDTHVRKRGVPILLWGLLVAASPFGHAATLTYCLPGAPDGFDIAQFESADTFEAAGLTLYDQLTAFKPGTAEVVPGLAESWQVGDGGLTYTFSLRKGVFFHETAWFKPSREMNADDVLFSFQRMQDKTHPSHAAARNGFVYWAGMGMAALVKTVEKLDPMTVRFTLKRPEAPFLSNMAVATLGSVFSAEYAERLHAAGKLEQLNSQPIGTGPFVFTSYQKDAVVRYAAHKKYWRGAPKSDQLVFAITGDADVRLQRVKAGECLVSWVRPDSAAQLSGDPQLTVQMSKPLMTAYLNLNTARAPTNNRVFREALWLALDKSALIHGAHGGRAVPAVSFLPAGMWGLDKSLTERRDPERAKQMIKASGYDGRELVMFILDRSRPRRMGEMIQADWARIGVKVRLQAFELGELFRRSGKGEHDISLQNWASDNGDPDNFFTPNLACDAVAGGGNKARWCHAPFDALLEGARKTTDMAQRTELYIKAQRIVYDEVPVIPLLYPESALVLNKRVSGVVPNPMGNADFRDASVK